jgi:eukaryotic-like serine/threonine-protein kinase
VPVFEVGQYEDQHYFSMKLIAGGSLDKQLKDFEDYPRRAARLVEVIAASIRHAHQRGILHRDLKPANVLLDVEGLPHITDFGLAKRVKGDSELTVSGAILGTPAYMAPEQASGKLGTVTTLTDVYGLGAILFALLTGRAPFGGTTVLDTLEQVRERPPESPRKLNPLASRDLEVICLKCLEKDPGRRYASADDLVEELRRWLQDKPIRARPVTVVRRAVKWLKRHRQIAALSCIVVAVALVGVGGIAWQRGIARDREAELTRAQGSARETEFDLARARQSVQAQKVVIAEKEAALELAEREYNDLYSQATGMGIEMVRRRRAEAEGNFLPPAAPMPEPLHVVWTLINKAENKIVLSRSQLNQERSRLEQTLRLVEHLENAAKHGASPNGGHQ